MLRRSGFVLLLLVGMVACQTAAPENVEVTRIVEVMEPVEVTRIVEIVEQVEVTRVVEVQVEAEPAESPSFSPLMPVEFDTIESSITGRKYSLTVVTPLSYMMSDASYPVIYVTDGDFYAIPLASAAGQLAFGQEIPEFIVVGVDYGSSNPMEWLELREMDMGPEGREDFLQFFEEELIPHVESAYRVDSTNRTLAGHSSGGNFALYGCLTAAGTFSNFIASSPGGAAELAGAVGDWATDPGATPAKLFLSVGDDDADEYVAGVKAFNEALVDEGSEALDHTMMILDGETHLSARPRAFTTGMKWLFESRPSASEPTIITSAEEFVGAYHYHDPDLPPSRRIFYVLEFLADGTFQAGGWDDDNQTILPMVFGEWWFEGGFLNIVDTDSGGADSGWECEPGLPGTYEINNFPKSSRFDVVEDPCNKDSPLTLGPFSRFRGLTSQRWKYGTPPPG